MISPTIDSSLDINQRQSFPSMAPPNSPLLSIPWSYKIDSILDLTGLTNAFEFLSQFISISNWFLASVKLYLHILMSCCQYACYLSTLYNSKRRISCWLTSRVSIQRFFCFKSFLYIWCYRRKFSINYLLARREIIIVPMSLCPSTDSSVYHSATVCVSLNKFSKMLFPFPIVMCRMGVM